MDLYNLDFVRVDKYSMRIREDKRDFPYLKLAVLGNVLLALVALIPWTMYGNELHAYTGPDGDRVYVHDLASVISGASSIFLGVAILCTFIVWFIARPDWTPPRKIKQVSLRTTSIPLMQRHIWHPVYARALTDLYYALEKNDIPDNEWVNVFTQLNAEMKPLTERREQIENPKPDVANYLFQIKSERELLERIAQ